MKRKKNFFAGPSVLPVSVLKQLEEQIADYQDSGFSMLEASHRSPVFDGMYQETLSLVRELMEIPDDYDVFFLGGGATLQFAMIPMNFLPEGGHADYIRSGSWSDKAYADGRKVGTVNLLFDGKDTGYTTLPDPGTVRPSEEAAYLYLCSNETIGGIEWQSWPDTGSVPLIADMSSDIFSRPVPVDAFSLIIAGIQKNLGPAGATLIILRKDMLKKTPDTLPSYLSYKTHADKTGLYNTPPVFSIWAVNLVLKWIKEKGGVEAMQSRAEKKSKLLYDAIDQSSGFYRSPVDPACRSRMNVVFRLPSEELEKAFLAESARLDMMGLKGHRSVGGCRASIYNALPPEDVQALADFMRDFAERNG